MNDYLSVFAHSNSSNSVLSSICALQNYKTVCTNCKLKALEIHQLHFFSKTKNLIFQVDLILLSL